LPRYWIGVKRSPCAPALVTDFDDAVRRARRAGAGQGRAFGAARRGRGGALALRGGLAGGAGFVPFFFPRAFARKGGESSPSSSVSISASMPFQPSGGASPRASKRKREGVAA
jgi:hypothetical protein